MSSKDRYYAATGAVIYAALRIVDRVQTAVRVQRRKRPLTERERAVLQPIFGDSLAYDRIQVVDGRAGVLSISGRPFTMGHTIYLRPYSERTLVHECVHVWQFAHGGFRYIGNSTFHQLGSKVLRRSYRPYDWRPGIDAGDAWAQLTSVEAQAKFVEDVYDRGVSGPDESPGAFFRGDGAGPNAFRDRGTDYTAQANAAWQAIRS